MEQLKRRSLAYDLDILCITEQNQNLKRIPIQHQLRNMTQGWWERRRVTQAFNNNFDSRKEQQIGGVSIIAANTLAHRSTIVQNDPTGLGRWSSLLIQGKRGFSTRIICAYRPCKSSGPDTAYMQQALYFNQIHRKGDPRNLFMDDLANAIIVWQQSGEQIILTGDFNTGDKTNDNRLQQFWEPWLTKTGLINTHKQFSPTGNTPSTHERGRVQIDYILTSPGITVNRAGFLPFSKFPGDHRAIWVDVKLTDIIGYKPQPLLMAKARRLTLHDPRVVERYLKALRSYDKNHRFSERLIALSEISNSQWTDAHTEEYQVISEKFRSAMINAEKMCRKFKTGAHPWSPQLDNARRSKFYWELKVKHLLGLHVPMKKLLKLQASLNIIPQLLSLHETMEKQQLARREYRKVKRCSFQYRLSFREELATAIVSHRQINQRSALRELINREESRDMHHRIKWTRKKYQSLSTSGVLISSPSGSKQLISDKATLEAVIIEENEKKFHQTEGQCPLTEGQLLQDIGLCGTGPAVPAILSGRYIPPPGSCHATKSFLKACKRPPHISPPDYDHMSYNHYCRAWSQAKERTGSGQVHFGHWKAAIHDDTLSTS